MLVLALLHPIATLSWWRWSIHPSTALGIAALAAVYLWGARRLGRMPSLAQRICFFSGLLVMFGSLNGPVHDLSDDYLFSAHMVQHLLLTLAMPPLLLSGVPGWMLRPLLARRGIAPVARFLTRPAICFVVFNLVIAAWHLPPLYNAAMANHNIHILEHLMFMAAAVMMWWPLLSQLPEFPRLAYPGQMLYSFLMSISGGLEAFHRLVVGSLERLLQLPIELGVPSPQVSQHQARSQKIRHEYLNPGYLAERGLSKSGRDHVEPHRHDYESHEKSGQNPGRPLRLVYDHGEDDPDDDERRVVEDRVAENLGESRIPHHVFSENADDTLAEKNRRGEWMAGDRVDDQEPDCDCGCADKAGDHAFTQKVVRPLSHWFL